jgi:hypothetical protein
MGGSDDEEEATGQGECVSSEEEEIWMGDEKDCMLWKVQKLNLYPVFMADRWKVSLEIIFLSFPNLLEGLARQSRSQMGG